MVLLPLFLAKLKDLESGMAKCSMVLSYSWTRQVTCYATVALIGLFSSPALAQRGQLWQVFGSGTGGAEKVKVCLVSLAGRWVEKDPKQPDACQEMLIAALDTHEIWPDSQFYYSESPKPNSHGQMSLWRDSRLFKLNYGYTTPNESAVLLAFRQSGAEERLDSISLASEQKCEAGYRAAVNSDEIDKIRGKCGAYAGLAHRDAITRIANRDQVDEEAKAEMLAAKSRPKCSTVRFTGIAVGSDWQSLDSLRALPDAQQVAERHPLRCGPSGLTQTYTCDGVAELVDQVGYVIAWTETDYQIATSVDLEIGRKDTLLYVNRSDATCVDGAAPSLDFQANLKNFLNSHNKNR